MLRRLLRWMICVTVACLLLGGPLHPARAMPIADTVLYNQPSIAAGGLFFSSLRDPNGSDNDQWVWDAFTLSATADITEVRWRGGYDPARFGLGGAVNNFTVSIFASNAGNTQPDLSRPPLVRYEVGGNANETPGPVLGNTQMRDYRFALPAAFHASSGVKYWVQIEAHQPGSLPDWGLTRGEGGDGFHFRRRAGETVYETITGDTTFALFGALAAPQVVYLPFMRR